MESPAIVAPNPTFEFFAKGFALLKVDRYIIDEASGANRTLIGICRNLPEPWAFLRDGESEEGPDVGCIDVRGKEAKDHKFYFHFAPDVWELARWAGKEPTSEMHEALRAMERAYKHINQKMYLFAMLLEEVRPGFLMPNFAYRLKQAGELISPYSTTTLRGLLYPDVPSQSGAQNHWDKSTLTGHCGDKHGELYGLFGEEKQRVSISPPSGWMVVFPGIKMLWESNGSILPLEHGSTNEPGFDREALVQFAHCEIDYRVRSNKQAWKDFWEHYHQP